MRGEDEVYSLATAMLCATRRYKASKALIFIALEAKSSGLFLPPVLWYRVHYTLTHKTLDNMSSLISKLTPKEAEARKALLQDMSVAELRREWVILFGNQPYTTRNRSFLIKRLTWRINTLVPGGLSERALKRAAELADETLIRLKPQRFRVEEQDDGLWMVLENARYQSFTKCVSVTYTLIRLLRFFSIISSHASRKRSRPSLLDLLPLIVVFHPLFKFRSLA